MKEMLAVDIQRILSAVDHTLLAQAATGDQIRALCDEGLEYRTASVCIPSVFVPLARAYAPKLAVCTVAGFPNGYVPTAVKVFETRQALDDGADEIDMVIHVGAVKEGRYGDVLRDIEQVKRACGEHILKVIVETCLLSEEEKIELCRVVTESGADFIKTSTGFSTGGATIEDIVLFAKHVGSRVRIKAAGGVRSLEVAEAFLNAGCSRLGTSSIVTLVRRGEAKGY